MALKYGFSMYHSTGLKYSMISNTFSTYLLFSCLAASSSSRVLNLRFAPTLVVWSCEYILHSGLAQRTAPWTISVNDPERRDSRQTLK